MTWVSGAATYNLNGSKRGGFYGEFDSEGVWIEWEIWRTDGGAYFQISYGDARGEERTRFQALSEAEVIDIYRTSDVEIVDPTVMPKLPPDAQRVGFI